jgi:endo-1,4-beta-D-glucanase Y
MINKESEPGNDGTFTNMFNKKEKMVVFVPEPQADSFTDPSYHLPHYCQLWGILADKQNDFWSDAAEKSREFLKKAAHDSTGLFPDYARFNGSYMSVEWRQ